ncbi:MAG TPA: PilZ domain-containing protein [Thiopseudomonas sp.]|nr:PilZ domain-containing protein [Thiopseudomonas sp.]
MILFVCVWKHLSPLSSMAHGYAALCIDLSSTGLQIETEASLEFSQGQKLHVSIPSTHAKLYGLEAETQVQRIEHLDNGYVALGLKIISMQ